MRTAPWEPWSRGQIALIVVYILLLYVAGWEVLTVASGNHAGYPWGWEGGGWAYASPANYLRGAVAGWVQLAAWFILGLSVRCRDYSLIVLATPLLHGPATTIAGILLN